MTLLKQSLPSFPRCVSDESRFGDAPRRRPWDRIPQGLYLLGMLLLCLVPRLWMAGLVRSVCHDGYYYISAAAACRDGEWVYAFNYLNLNIFPLILVSVQSLGLTWIAAGKLWSALISSLAVLPMFGWVRRLFSDRVAWAACFLYAVHPEFVEFSIEPVRDPTFWFLFNLCLYTTWCAVSEAKLRWFLTGGLTLALAVHTRSEGWLLILPWGIWGIRQGMLWPGRRRRLLGGSALWLAITPALVVLINITVLHDEPDWQWGRLGHFVMGWHWAKEKLHLAPVGSADAIAAWNRKQDPRTGRLATPAPPARRKPITFLRYLKQFASAFEQVNLGLLICGLYWSGREFWNWDRSALLAVALALAGGVWILYEKSGLLNGRYFYPVYLALIPFCAAGLLAVLERLKERAERSSRTWLKPSYSAAFMILLLLSLGWTDAFTTYHASREREAELGVQLAKTYGPFCFVVTDLQGTRAGYHAQDDIPAILYHWGTIEKQFNRPYDLLILSRATTPQSEDPVIEAAAARMGLKRVKFPKDQYPDGHFLVFVRPREAR